MAQQYRSLELVGASMESFEEAVRAAVRRASGTMGGLQWLEVLEQRASLDGAEVREFQVRVRIWYEGGEAGATNV